MRLNELWLELAEVTLTNASPVHWIKRDEGHWSALFEVGDRHFKISFVRLSGTGRQSSWRVDFRSTNTQAGPAKVSETAGIMGTVAAAIREFLDTVQPEKLQMSPTNARLEKLYRAVLKRLAPSISHAYSVDERWYRDLFGEFVLCRHAEWLYGGWTI